MQQPLLALNILLPAFILLAAGGAPAFVDAWTGHREVFGSDNYYLTVDYGSNPNGVLAPQTGSLRFSGSIVTDRGEFPIYGVRVKEGRTVSLKFQSAAGDFVASHNTATCPSKLTLRPTKSTAGFPTETLQSGRCL